MEKAFLLKIIISFIVAGIWIGGATLLAERLGSKKGGLISNLPSTILIALVFVALVQDAQFAANATDAVPIGMLIDTLFLLIFILLLKYGLIKTVLLSLSTWFGLAFLAYLHYFLLLASLSYFFSFSTKNLGGIIIMRYNKKQLDYQ